MQILAETVRIEGARILATLIRTVGDVQTAEDAVQEATLAALATWPVTGVPPSPRAWLTVTARRKAIDILRRERARPDKERDGARLIELERPELPTDEVVHDDQLRLIFICCHPTLSPPTRVALALRTLCGLTPAQIAGVLLATEAGTAKQLTRARQKIAAAHIPYRVPPEQELPDRLPAVCGVIHSLYTAGHAPINGGAAYDVDTCTEALRLAGLLHDPAGPAKSQPVGQRFHRTRNSAAERLAAPLSRPGGCVSAAGGHRSGTCPGGQLRRNRLGGDPAALRPADVGRAQRCGGAGPNRRCRRGNRSLGRTDDDGRVTPEPTVACCSRRAARARG